MNRRCNATAAELMYAMFAIVGLFQSVDGHLYMTTPISRNFWATTTFNNENLEYFTNCPQCFQSKGPVDVRARAEALTDPIELSLYGNGSWPHLSAFERGELAPNGNYVETDAIAVRHGICGDPQQTAEEGSNRFGQENTVYPVLEIYTQGSILEVKILVQTSHAGHLEFFLCNTADMDDPEGVATQGCFNMHPLDRAEDDGVASPIDPNHPGRYYLDPPCRASETDQTIMPDTETGYIVTARYQLPSSITCTRCIVQMVYYTGNSCKHPGYDEFNPDSWPSECAPTKEDWIRTFLGLCGDGDNYPEEYWNCADIEITSDGIPSNPAPSPEASTDFESPAPAIDESTTQETPTQTIRVAEPFNEPVPLGITLAPATSASSGAAGELPSDGCDEAVEAYGQCGGESFEGSTCCLPGLECIERNQWYSQCVPETRA